MTFCVLIKAEDLSSVQQARWVPAWGGTVEVWERERQKADWFGLEEEKKADFTTKMK